MRIGRPPCLPEWLLLGPRAVLGLVLLASALCRMLWLERPPRALIFDEAYYVNAARVILGWDVPEGDTYADSPPGLDPNREHPPLGKLLIAGSMRLFGDNAFGWRLSSVVAGMASILLVYAVTRAAGGDEWLGVLAGGIFAFDNLVLVHSRIGTLDMPMVALVLLGAWCWLRGWRMASGGACAVAALVKLGAVYGLAALLLLELGRGARNSIGAPTRNASALRAPLLLALGFAGAWLGGLWVLDLAFTPYNTPWSHLRFMLDYGFAIERPGGPANDESNPWQWLYNEVQMTYLRVNEDIAVDGDVVATRPIVYFRGAMNPMIIGAAPLAVSYVAWRAWRFRDLLSLWVVAWIACTYLSFVALGLLTDRTMYIFYFLVTIPAVAVAIAQTLRQAGLARAVTWGYALGVLIGFAGYFPFRRIF